MYRGSLVFGPNPFVAYDSNCLIGFSKAQNWLMKTFPSFYTPKLSLDRSAIAEIKAISQSGVTVEIIVWDITGKMNKAYARLTKRFVKKYGDKYRFVFVDSPIAIRARQYDRIYTNRPDTLTMFSDDMVSLTQFAQNTELKKKQDAFLKGFKI
jgi:hypothetical protein